MPNVLERFEQFLMTKHNLSLHDFVYAGAKNYYSMCRYINQDYITKNQIQIDAVGEFPEFIEQDNTRDMIEVFAQETSTPIESIYEALEICKMDLVEYVVANADEIAREVNEEN